MSPRMVIPGLVLGLSFGEVLLASCRSDRSDRSDQSAEAEVMVDTAYAIAAYRTEAQARLDHLALRIARLNVAVGERAGITGRLAGLEERRDQLGRQIEAFDPSAADWEQQAARLDSALAALGQEVDRLAGRAGPPDTPR